MPEVRIATAADIEACVAIVDRLSDYFTPDVADKVRADWPRCRTWVLVDRDTVAGFAEVEVRSRVVAEILWAAVEPERRGNGLGTVLVDRVLALRADEGLSLVEVKTLDESAGYEPYEGTVAFWESRGFVK
ncbi:MAG: GNAT family N-acetyltransferase, partial [Acidimicrobiales bacterium]